MAILGGACGGQTQEETASPNAARSPIPSQLSTLGLDPEQLTDRYNRQASEDARIEDLEITDNEFSARVDATVRIYGSIATNGDIAHATLAYTGSTTTNDDPFYDVVADGMEQLGAVIAFSNFASAVAVNATEDEANLILTELDYPSGEGVAGSLQGVDNEATVAGVAFHLYDAGLNGILLTAEPASGSAG
jgi:tRNA U38,U39,U40 pseudouridine synthase TruA